MSDLVAKPEAIADLRNGLTRFAERQQETFERINADIRLMRDQFENEISQASYVVNMRNEQAQNCQREAMYAAAKGFWLDCTPYMQALQQAEQQLAQLKRAQDQFERAAEEYAWVQNSTRNGAIERDLPPAVRYLDAVRNGLEAYLEVQLRIGDELHLAQSPAQVQQYQPTLDALLAERKTEGEIRTRFPERGM